MLHLVKSTNLLTGRTLVLCGLLIAAVLALLPISAGAQCTKWDASGVLYIIQQGEKYMTRVELEQKGRVLTGRTTQTVLDKNLQPNYQATGTVDGTIDGDRFSVQIYWFNGLIGVYNAKVLPSGRLDGEGYEKSTPNVRPTWHSQDVLKCAPPPVVSAPPPPKPIRSSGKARPSEPTPPPPSSAPMKVPGIVASQVIFPYPGAFSGFVILTWDGGPDHPYAEVWVKVNSGDDTFVVEQGKGDRRVEVERGKTYQYILTDAGTTLATVSFTAY